MLGTETADVETSSEGYARRFAGAVGEHFLAVQARATLDLLAPWAGGSVLDVGGGHAQLAAPLSRHGFRVTVAGSSEVCRARLDRFLPAGAFDFRATDLLALPFPDRSFDAVLAFRLLPHAERWQELLAEMCRVARGAVVVDYPDLRSFNLLTGALGGALFGAKKRVEGNTRPYRCFTRREVTAELARHGFGRPVLRPQFFVPMVVHRAVGKAGFSRAVEGVSGALGLTRAFGSPIILRAERLATAT
ncbi:MAG TPA: class I SAM-dependent methyltransferase [Thermoanaerobaculia bacterium]|nr:class I SAM-dependent methyltransferase [Thermoanaerobaculia bacterium]